MMITRATLIDNYRTHNSWLIEQVAEKNTEINRLREALGFYADKESYAVNITEQWEPVFPVLRDDGRIARAALAGDPDD